AYGIIAQPRPVRTAVNVYLGGYLKEENIRFRDREIRFDVRPPRAAWTADVLLAFDELTKRYEGFELVVRPGRLRKGEVVGVVGPNARSEEHTSELQSRGHLVCRLLLEKKKNKST